MYLKIFMKKPNLRPMWAFLLLALVSLHSAQAQAQDKRTYRICVSVENEAACERMVASAPKIKCVAASDKIECIEKIVKNGADFMPLDPEEIYVAHKFLHDGFNVITEIRSQLFKDRDFRYEPVAVVRKSLSIRSISELEGKKSCHTGFGRNAGWKIPFSHLMDKNQLPKFCDAIKSTTPEKDLYAVSNYFTSACAPGQWVPDRTKDQQLKKKYPNLCELCADPGTCDKNDKYGGYEGALKCLTLKNGDIAWTKMDAVEKFFKLKESQPMPDVSSYEFLCWDGSTMPLTSKDPCSWAKRPWSAFLATTRLTSESVGDLQTQISTLRTKGIEETTSSNIVPDWLKSVLEFGRDKDNNLQFDVEYNIEPHVAKRTFPLGYLDIRKNYSVTIEKPSCATGDSIRFCVKSELEKEKCLALQLAAVGRRILPKVGCVLAENSLECIQKVAGGHADLVNLGPKEADWAKRNYELVPILSELESTSPTPFEESGPFKYALAIIKSSSQSKYRNISSLRGKRACFESINSLAGWNAPLNTLRTLGEIQGPTCSLSIQLSEYFSNRSCVPGAKDWAAERRMPWLPTENMCKLCAGDGPRPGQAFSPDSVCSDSPSERYFGDLGALRCLAEDVADVAFVDHVDLIKVLQDPGLSLNASDLRLLCPSGNTSDIDHFQHCNWGKVPTRKILGRGGSSEEIQIKRDDVKLTLLKISDTFSPGGKADVVFRLFGPYFGNQNLLFQDSSVGLCDHDLVKEDESLISDFDYCTTNKANIKDFNGFGVFFILLVFSYVAKFII